MKAPHVQNVKPVAGDFIATDWGDNLPTDFGQGIAWYCSNVIRTDYANDRYKVGYDNGDRWYTFKSFTGPKKSRTVGSYVFGANPI